jgi:hypothetical protein
MKTEKGVFKEGTRKRALASLLSRLIAMASVPIPVPIVMAIVMGCSLNLVLLKPIGRVAFCVA